MDRNYDQIMAWLSVYEGGKVDDPVDPGGRTNRGVTQAVYDGYRRAVGKNLKDVWDISDFEHDAIYLSQYWQPVMGSQLPSGVDAAVFDFCVHSGASRPVKTMQRIVGATADGVMGNITLGAVRAYCDKHSAAELCVEICASRMKFLRRLKVWWKYKNGWTRRIEGDEPGVQDGDVGVVDRSVMLT